MPSRSSSKKMASPRSGRSERWRRKPLGPADVVPKEQRQRNARANINVYRTSVAFSADRRARDYLVAFRGQADTGAGYKGLGSGIKEFHKGVSSSDDAKTELPEGEKIPSEARAESQAEAGERFLT